MSKTRIVILLVIVVLIGSGAYLLHVKKQTQEPKSDENNNQYAMVEKQTNPSQTSGTIVAIDPSKVIIEKYKEFECFDALNYGDSGLTEKAINQKYNTKNLPWCLPDGTYSLDSGEQATFSFDVATKFMLWIDANGAPVSAESASVTKDEFIKQVTAKDPILVTSNGTTTTLVELPYRQ